MRDADTLLTRRDAIHGVRAEEFDRVIKEDNIVMKRFIPYAKMSKQKKKALDEKRRGSWRGINPVTRKPPNPKAYNRKKMRKRSQDDDFSSASFLFNFSVLFLPQLRKKTG